MIARRLRQLPDVAEHEPVSAIEIGRTPLRGYVVLIVEYLLAEHRRAVNAKSGRPETILRCVNGSRQGISRQELKAVAQSFVDCGLQRVVSRGSDAFDAKHERGDTEKRNSLDGIGDGVGGQPVDGIRGTRQGRLVVAPGHRKVSASGACVREREQKVLVLVLSLQTVVLNRRVLEIRIGRNGEHRAAIACVWRTWQLSEVREGRGQRQYRETDVAGSMLHWRRRRDSWTAGRVD